MKRNRLFHQVCQVKIAKLLISFLTFKQRCEYDFLIMAPTNRVHYTAELKKQAKTIYFDPTGDCFRSYKKVAKALGVPRWQTITEWAKKNKWHDGPPQKPARFLLHLDSKEMFELHAEQWDQVAERSLNLLLTSTDHNLLGKALTIFKDALAQQKELNRRIRALQKSDFSDKPKKTKENAESNIFPFDRAQENETE